MVNKNILTTWACQSAAHAANTESSDSSAGCHLEKQELSVLQLVVHVVPDVIPEAEVEALTAGGSVSPGTAEEPKVREVGDNQADETKDTETNE